MRRSFALVLTALLLVSALTACGSKNNNTARDPVSPESSTSGTTQSGTGNTGSGNTQSDTGNTNSGTMQDDKHQDHASGDTLLEDAGDAVGDVVGGVEDAVDDVLPNGNANTRQRSTGGVSYGDMMHNDRR